MSKYSVVLTNPTILPEGVQILEQEADVFITDGPSEEEIIRCINEHHAAAIFVRVELITRRVIESCPSLKIIQEHGIGCDNIDLEAAAEHGVQVLNIPGGTTVAVSEHAVMMVLVLAYDLLNQEQTIRSHDHVSYSPIVLDGKTLFIIGLGGIGKRVAKKLQGIGMKVCAYDEYVSETAMSNLGVTKLDKLEEGLRKADVISIHAPLTDETYHMIGEKQLDMMKPNVILVNCARGGLVDEEALEAALKEGRIRGAGIDVFAEEPINKDHNHIVSLDNAICSPHSAGSSLEGRARPAMWGAQGILSALHGEDMGMKLVNRKQLQLHGYVK